MAFSSFNPATVATGTGGGGGGGGGTAAAASQIIVFTDNFTDTGSVVLSSHTADTGQVYTNTVGTIPNITVASGSAYNSSSFGDVGVSNYVAPIGAEEATIRIIKGAISGLPNVGIALRCFVNSPNRRLYWGLYQEGTGYQFKRTDIPSVHLLIATIAGTAPEDGDELRFTVSGTGTEVVLTLFLNGEQVATYTDTDANRITVPGRVGIIVGDPTFTGAGNYRVDRITSPGLVTPFWVNVKDYGAKADNRTVFTGAITLGTPNLDISPAVFATDCDGKAIYVRNAESPGDTLETTILSHSGSTAVLANNATRTVSGERVDYGTIDVVAFNKAIAAVPVVGGTVFVPAGNYLIGTASITGGPLNRINIDRDNIGFIGEGIGRSNLFYSSRRGASSGLRGFGDCIFCGNDGSLPTRVNLTLKDFTIRNLSVTAEGSGHRPAALEIYSYSKIVVDGVELIDGKGNSALQIAGQVSPPSTDVVVQNCIIRADAGNYMEGDGINLGQFTRVRVVHNYIYGPSRHGYEGGGNCYDQYIAFNTIDMNGGGLSGINPTGGNRTVVEGNNIINVAGPSGYGVDFTTDVGATFMAKDNRIIGNYIQMIASTGTAAIRIQNTSGHTAVIHCDRYVIMGNIIENLGTTNKGIYIAETADLMPEVIIQSNKINMNNPTGVTVYILNAAGNPTRNILVKGNIIENCYTVVGGGAGISANAAKRLIYSDNLLTTPNVNSYDGYSLSSFYTGAGGEIGAGLTMTNDKTVGAIAGLDVAAVILPSGISAAQEKLVIWASVIAGGIVRFYEWNPTGAGILPVQVKAVVIRSQKLG